MYYVAQGEDINPEIAQIQAIARYIAARRLRGANSDELRKDIESGLDGSTLPSGHPCRGPDGKNVCTLTAIATGLIEGERLVQTQKRVSAPKGLSTAFVLLLGVSALLFFSDSKG